MWAVRAGTGAQEAPTDGRAAAQRASRGPGSELGWQSQTPPALPSTPQPGPCPPPRAWELHPRCPLGPGEEARPRGPREPSSRAPPVSAVCLGAPPPGRGFSPPRIRLLLRCGQHRARVWAQPPGQETPQGAAHLRSCPRPHAGWTRGREFILLPQIPTPWTETKKREPGSLPCRGLRFSSAKRALGEARVTREISPKTVGLETEGDWTSLPTFSPLSR